MVLMFLAMKSITGWILAGSAHPTHVTPVTGKARSWRARTTLDVTDAPSSLISEPHGTHARFLVAAPPPKAAPAMSALAVLSAPSASPSSPESPPRPPSLSSSSSSSSYSRGRFVAAPARRFLAGCLLASLPRRPPPPWSLAVLEAPSRSLRPRISSSIMEMGPNTESGLFLAADRPRPAAAAHTGCWAAAGGGGPAPPPAADGRFCAFTASPTGSGATDSSSTSLSSIYAPLISTLTHAHAHPLSC